MKSKPAKPVKIFRRQLVRRKSDPNRLDMRYKRNRIWVEQTQKEQQPALPF